ncbi:hypothetical protein FB451DRAFT_363224 [Mycena latifolia]|nr:hypothetical protein FB451DRAFT_363224 [Mycena latifolia]
MRILLSLFRSTFLLCILSCAVYASWAPRAKRLSPLRPHKHHSTLNQPGVIRGLLVPRQGVCDPGFFPCDDSLGCCQSGETCCTGGGCCEAGFYCDTIGCCANGETCGGATTGCTSSEDTPCGSFCCRPSESCVSDSDGELDCQAGGSPTTKPPPPPTTQKKTTTTTQRTTTTHHEIETTPTPETSTDTDDSGPGQPTDSSDSETSIGSGGENTVIGSTQTAGSGAGKSSPTSINTLSGGDVGPGPTPGVPDSASRNAVGALWVSLFVAAAVV